MPLKEYERKTESKSKREGDTERGRETDRGKERKRDRKGNQLNITDLLCLPLQNPASTNTKFVIIFAFSAPAKLAIGKLFAT